MAIDPVDCLIGPADQIKAHKAERRRAMLAAQAETHERNRARVARIQAAYKRGEWSTLSGAFQIL